MVRIWKSAILLGEKGTVSDKGESGRIMRVCGQKVVSSRTGSAFALGA